MRASDKTQLWVLLSEVKDINLRNKVFDSIVDMIELLLVEGRAR